MTATLSFIAIIAVIITVHEFGHYLVARLNGVKILTFSIGFGPKLFGWTDRSGTEWKVCAIPLGGYVRMFGDVMEGSFTEAEKAQSYAAKGPLARISILLAGPAMNFVLALVLFTALAMYGQPYQMPQIGSVTAGSPAAVAGLEAGDVAVAVDGHSLTTAHELLQLLPTAGQPFVLTVKRNGQLVQLHMSPDAAGHIGITFAEGATGFTAGKGPLDAAASSAKKTWDMTSAIGSAVEQMVTGQTDASKNVGGPIAIAREAGQITHAMGFYGLVLFTGFISLNIGLMNLLPIPPLDGGKIFFALFELVGLPIPQPLEIAISVLGVLLFLLLMGYSTLLDISRLFGG